MIRFQVKELFELYDKDQDESLTLNELAAMLQDIGNKITALPAVCTPYCRNPQPPSDPSRLKDCPGCLSTRQISWSEITPTDEAGGKPNPEHDPTRGCG